MQTQEQRLHQALVAEMKVFQVMKPDMQSLMRELNRMTIYIKTIKSVDGLEMNVEQLINQVKQDKITSALIYQHFNRSSINLLLCMLIVDQCKKKESGDQFEKLQAFYFVKWFQDMLEDRDKKHTLFLALAAIIQTQNELCSDEAALDIEMISYTTYTTNVCWFGLLNRHGLKPSSSA